MFLNIFKSKLSSQRYHRNLNFYRTDYYDSVNYHSFEYLHSEIPNLNNKDINQILNNLLEKDYYKNKRENDRLCASLVKYNGLYLKDIHKDARSSFINFIAVKNNGLSLEYVNNHDYIQEYDGFEEGFGMVTLYGYTSIFIIYLEAIKQNGLAVQYMKPQYIPHHDIKRVDSIKSNIYYEACLQNPEAIKLFTWPDEDLYLKLIETHPSIIKLISHPTYNMKLLAVKKDLTLISDVKQNWHLANYIINHHPNLISELEDKYKPWHLRDNTLSE